MQDAESCDEDIRQLRENQSDLGKSLEDKQIMVQQLQGQVDEMEREAELLGDNKFRVGVKWVGLIFGPFCSLDTEIVLVFELSSYLHW